MHTSVLFPESVLGLTVGCLLADLFSAFGVLDIGIGTLATLLAALLTLLCGRLGRERFLPKLLACLSPILLNGILVGGVIAWVTAPPGAFASAWLTSGLWVAAGETAILLPVGLPLLLTLPRRAFFKKWLENYQSDDSQKIYRKGKL